MISDLLMILLATRYNLRMGISDVVLYFLSSNIAKHFDFGMFLFTNLIIFSKLTVPGIEATMQSIT